MTMLVRQNSYAAYLDGDVSAVEALRSLCSDYEEVEASYKDFEGIRNQLREQISVVLDRLGGKAEIKGFGALTLTAPVIVKGFDKARVVALIGELMDEHPDIAERLAACATQTSRAGGLRIERERPPR